MILQTLLVWLLAAGPLQQGPWHSTRKGYSLKMYNAAGELEFER